MSARFRSFLVLGCAWPLVACQHTKPASHSDSDRAMPQAPQTVPEQSHYQRTSSHAEVIEFLQALDAVEDPRWHRTHFGVTPEGREQPLILIADPPVRTPEEAKASGKPRLFVMANIHAGEVEGKEACQELLREILWAEAGQAPYPVADLVLMVAPIYNADGNDRFEGNHRPGQHGPPLVGTRATAKGLDLNRDYMKLDNEEARSLVRLFRDWDPHVMVDLHTTNGSAHGFELTYAPPLTPAAHPELLSLLEREWLPTIRTRVRERHGFELFDYGNFMTEEGRFKDEPDRITGWRSFDHRPRFGTNYVGLRNRIAILSEAYAYLDFPTRIAVTKAFVREILVLAAEQGPAIVAACQRWDEETMAAGGTGSLSQPIAAELVDRGEPETILLRAVEERTDPDTGDRYRAATGPKTELQVPCYVKFVTSESRVAPKGYLLPDAPAPLLERLQDQGVRFERLTEAWGTTVEVHRVKETSVSSRAFEGHQTRRVAWDVRTETRRFEAGTPYVELDQPLARLAFQLLDPQSNDGFVVWNFYDAVLTAGAGVELPVYGMR